MPLSKSSLSSSFLSESEPNPLRQQRSCTQSDPSLASFLSLSPSMSVLKPGLQILWCCFLLEARELCLLLLIWLLWLLGIRLHAAASIHCLLGSIYSMDPATRGWGLGDCRMCHMERNWRLQPVAPSDLSADSQHLLASYVWVSLLQSGCPSPSLQFLPSDTTGEWRQTVPHSLLM